MLDKPNKSNTYSCPECDNLITYDQLIKVGTIIECPACGSESEFITVDPPRLSPLEEEK